MLKDVNRIAEGKVVENLVHYVLDEPRSNLFYLIGLNLKKRERTELIKFLKENVEPFAWTPYKMLKILELYQAQAQC